MAPHTHHNGATALSIMIANGFARTGKLTCLAHTKPISESFYDYLSLESYQDKTSTPSQIVKILREGAISKEDIRDYCQRVSENIEVFTNNATNFSQDDMNYMLNYMVESFPHEHIVLDIDDNDIEQNKHIISMCDVVVLCITQSIEELKQFYDQKDSILKSIGDKPIVVVINKYNSIKGSIKETANWMGIKRPNNWIILHENPWICWATNHGKMSQLFSRINSKDSRVMELDSEIAKICDVIAKAKVSKSKRR